MPSLDIVNNSTLTLQQDNLTRSFRFSSTVIGEAFACNIQVFWCGVHLCLVDLSANEFFRTFVPFIRHVLLLQIFPRSLYLIQWSPMVLADYLLRTVADPGFPRGGGANSPGGAPTYDFAKFSQKLHEIERIWTPGGGARPKFYYVDPPL